MLFSLACRVKIKPGTYGREGVEDKVTHSCALPHPPSTPREQLSKQG